MGRFRPPSQGPELTDVEAQGVEAAFEDLETARNAIAALGRAGLEGQHITLRGPGADEAAGRMETANADASYVGHWLRNVAAGGLFGGGLGMVVAAVVLGLSGYDASSEDVIAFVALSALGMGIAGALIASMGSLQASETWALTFQRSAKGATVGVETRDAGEIERATSILKDHNPRSLRRIDKGRTFGRSGV